MLRPDKNQIPQNTCTREKKGGLVLDKGTLTFLSALLVVLGIAGISTLIDARPPASTVRVNTPHQSSIAPDIIPAEQETQTENRDQLSGNNYSSIPTLARPDSTTRSITIPPRYTHTHEPPEVMSADRLAIEPSLPFEEEDLPSVPSVTLPKEISEPQTNGNEDRAGTDSAETPSPIRSYATPTLTPDDPVFSQLASYEATYRILSDGVRYNSHYAGLFGTLTIRIENTCNGWLQNAKRDIQIQPQNIAGIIQTLGTSSEWMSRDGTVTRFFEKLLSNNQLIYAYKGTATRDNFTGTGTISFISPEGETTKIPQNAVFPVAYTFYELKALRANAPKLFTLSTFDLETPDNPITHHTISIGDETTVEDAVVVSALPNAEDRRGRYITVTEFNDTTDEMTPTGTIRKTMLENGIETAATITTPTDSQRITLEKLTILPNPVCSAP